MCLGTLPSLNVDTPHEISNGSAAVDPESVLELFASICDRAREVVSSNTDWGDSGQRAGQYKVDLDVDDVCVGPLLASGLDVLSEESGVQISNGNSPSGQIVVVDPLDGSTNASLGLPWFATSLCLLVDRVPTVAMVANLATGDRYTAARGGGATLGGEPLAIEQRAPIEDAVIAVSGLPPRHYGWRQFRAMGASALDICAVASGAFDGFVDMSKDAHGVWDYLGALLVLEEAGGLIVDALGRDLVVLDDVARRTPVAASGEVLLGVLLSERQGSALDA
jgi:myo-inositol-1(or 4)-monophosphatase